MSPPEVEVLKLKFPSAETGTIFCTMSYKIKSKLATLVQMICSLTIMVLVFVSHVMYTPKDIENAIMFAEYNMNRESVYHISDPESTLKIVFLVATLLFVLHASLYSGIQKDKFKIVIGCWAIVLSILVLLVTRGTFQSVKGSTPSGAEALWSVVYICQIYFVLMYMWMELPTQFKTHPEKLQMVTVNKI